jgi:hypothetical protein
MILSLGVLQAQDNRSDNKRWDSDVIDALKQDNRIYIVIAVLVIILTSLFYYLWRIDKKITRLENQIRK